jgi:site-specific recombinase XerD
MAFFKWVNDFGFDFIHLCIAEAQEYQLYLCTKTNEDGSVHYSRVTVSTMVDRIRRFYEYLRKIKVIHSNPFNEIQTIRQKKTIPKNILNEEEMSKFLRHFREFNKAKNLIERRRLYRAHVLAEFMYSTGARINEVMKVRREDIDFLRGTVIVYDDKTGKSRECILNEYAAKVLQIFIEEMRSYALVSNIKRSDSLFGAGSSLVVWFNGVLTSESAKLGLSKVTTHHFRHAVGFHLLRAGCDIRYIKEILGHEELGTTQIYTKVDKQDLKSVIDKFHPRKINRTKSPETESPGAEN